MIWRNPPDPDGRVWPAALTRKVGGRVVEIRLDRRSMVSISEAASIVNKDPSTVWRWIQGGRLKGIRSQGRIRIPMSALRRYLPRSSGIFLK